MDINNLDEYISLVVDATVKTGIIRQMEAFRSGFNQVSGFLCPLWISMYYSILPRLASVEATSKSPIKNRILSRIPKQDSSPFELNEQLAWPFSVSWNLDSVGLRQNTGSVGE